jgi:deoxyribonuclease-4
MQVFARSPQRWRDKSLEPKEIEEFIRRRRKFRIKPVFVHISYLINLASPNPRLYQGSIDAYVEDILEAGLIHADYIVTHMGSHKQTSEEAGLKRLTHALNVILEKTKRARVGILLENTAGSGSWLGYTFRHHRQIIEGLKYRERVGICVDTAHAYLAGYDIATEEGLEGMLSEIDRMVGIRLIRCIHLNDAKDKLGSHHDRHENIGEGHIGIPGMRRIVNHPKLRGLPFILETPKSTDDAQDLLNLKTVRRLRKD